MRTIKQRFHKRPIKMYGRPWGAEVEGKHIDGIPTLVEATHGVFTPSSQSCTLEGVVTVKSRSGVAVFGQEYTPTGVNHKLYLAPNPITFGKGSTPTFIQVSEGEVYKILFNRPRNAKDQLAILSDEEIMVEAVVRGLALKQQPFWGRASRLKPEDRSILTALIDDKMLLQECARRGIARL